MTRKTKWYTVAGYLAVIYMALLFLYPLIKVTWSSVSTNNGFSLDNYITIFTTPLYLKVLFKTLWVSLVSTLIALILGYSLAYFIATRESNKQGFWLMLIISPMFMSLTVRLFGWMIFLGQGGPLVALLTPLVSPETRLTILFSPIAIIIGIVHYVLPFVVLNIYSALKKLEPTLLEAATMLGASSFRAFWTVTFPLSLPGVIAGSSLAFALSASTFLVPLMLGGPSDNLLANMAYNSIINIGNLGMGAAISMVLLIIVVIVLAVMGRLERRGHIA